MSAFRPLNVALVCLCTLIAIYAVAKPSPQQKMDNITAGRVKQMLEDAHDLVKNYYYDDTFRGIDWDARYKEYKEKLKQINTLAQGYAVIAQFLDALNDSHTFFIPPPRPAHLDYGFDIAMVGDKPFIVRVKPGSDAETKLHPGDEVLAFNRYPVKRDSFPKMQYFFKVLAPQSESALVLRDPQGQQRQVSVQTKIVETKRVLDLAGGDRAILIDDQEKYGRLLRQRFFEIDDVMIWKMPEFNLSESDVDHLFAVAAKHKTLILDLRENPGGSVVTLDRMIGNLFENDVNLGDRKGRHDHKNLKPEIAKGRGKHAFTGDLIVLVDSKSASAAEVFARVIQLEHRGKVIGDRSSGLVMEAQRIPEVDHGGNLVFYGFSITIADLIMKDGKSLERVGVEPDETILPSASDLAYSRDPALSRAAELAGIKLTPDQAGKLFPYEWAPM